MGFRTRARLAWVWLGIGVTGCTTPVTSTEEPVAPPAASTAPAAAVGGTPVASAPAIRVAPPTAASTSPAPTITAPQAPAVSAPAPAMQPTAAGAAAPSSSDVSPASSELFLPCDAQRAAASACATCHGTTLLGGAPMPLLSYADWHKPAATQPTLKVYELAQMRLKDQARPMPPGGQIEDSARAALDAWLSGGATGATAAAAASCVTASEPGKVSGSEDGSFGEIVAAEGEVCYEFPVHASNTDAKDTTPYDVGDGEHYEQFYFDVPWPAGTVATRYGAKYDNVRVLHHWLLFSTNESDPVGSHKTAPLPTLAGVDAQLLAGWAVGGSNMAAPADTGFELPNPGRKLNVQWHFYNSSGTKQVDRSIVQVCTVPAAMRTNTATLSWLGQEDLNGNRFLGGAGMPPHQESTFTGTCTPRRRGMNNTDPINIVIFWPHMHQLGTAMSATINRANGMKEVVFDKPFDFSAQLHFTVDQKLYPGDTITTTCRFNNTTDRGVPFGESSDTEMCYMFTYAWPANTLENGAASLIGAKNACW